MSKHITRSHNKSLLLYHFVYPIKYRRDVLTDRVAKTLKELCLEIQKRHDIHFIEIGTDLDHAHFLVQSVPTASPAEITNTLKGTLGNKLFQLHPEVKEKLWGGHFWSEGYYVNTVSQYGNEQAIKNYVKNQGQNYTKLYRGQLTLFPGVV
jgi:REP element-mobilizing transposase RayT